MSRKYDTPARLEAKLHDDEPWFAVRAQDALAPLLVATYARVARQAGLHDLATSVEQLGIELLRWQAAHPELVRLPD